MPVIEARENPKFTRAEQQPLDQEIYSVIIIDNDTNTYQQVIEICMAALPCDYEHALSIALAVDHNGRAEVLRAPAPEARRVAEIIRTIGIEVLLVPA